MTEEDWTIFITFGICALVGLLGMSAEVAESLREKWWTDSEVWAGPGSFLAYLSIAGAVLVVAGVFG